jgi:hypothetical protein
MLTTVENVHALFELGPVLSYSGFATIYTIRGDAARILRVQEYTNTPDILDEVRYVERMNMAGLTPLTIGNYTDGTYHAMYCQRYEMDLERWLNESDVRVQCRSIWTMRVCQLLRAMSRIGLFCIDLKPANIVVKTDAATNILTDMKLIDFGGGLCWESKHLLGRPVSWHVVYAVMLLVFNASMIQTRATPHMDVEGPFGDRIRKLLLNPETQSTVVEVMSLNMIRRYWENLFFRVDQSDYLEHFGLQKETLLGL